MIPPSGSTVAGQLAALGPWFHDPEIRGVLDHTSSNLLHSVWSMVSRRIPEDPSGATLSTQAHPAPHVYPCAPPADAGIGTGAPP